MPSRLTLYLIRNFAGAFFPLFFTLFAISSVVAIIRLADITAIVKLSSVDFFTLYMFGVPQLFFYSLPISFFIASSMALSKLSFDSEITAMIALGATKMTVIKPFAILACILTLILLYLGLIASPVSNGEAKAFIDLKKSTSRLNLEANSVGQKFGDWLVFALREDKNSSFGDVVLFSKSFKSQMMSDKHGFENKIIYSQNASIFPDGDIPVLLLKNGSGILYDDNATVPNTKKLFFKSLFLREEVKEIKNKRADVLGYWLTSFSDKKRAKDFVDTFLVSMAPILTFFLTFTLGINSYRIGKNHTGLYSIATICTYYLSILLLSSKITFFAIPVIIAIWIALTYYLYKKSLFSRY